MRKVRVKKYLLFMFGAWIRLEDNVELYGHIKDVLETILSTNELSFVTGAHTLIACIESHSSFEEISDLLEEFLKPQIPAYFLMPKPRKLSYRLDSNLEDHLFNDGKVKRKSNINPEIAKLLQQQLKNIVDSRFKNLITDLDKPVKMGKIKKNLRPMSVDNLLDKIIDEGLDSLTHAELEFLNKYNK